MRNWNQGHKKQINYIWKKGRFIGPKPWYFLFNFIVLEEKKNFEGVIETLKIEASKQIKPEEKEIFILPLKGLKFST